MVVAELLLILVPMVVSIPSCKINSAFNQMFSATKMLAVESFS